MDDLRFYILFNSISVISGRWADDNERLCAMGTPFAIFGLNILEKLNTFVYLVSYLHNLNIITCF